MRYAKTAPKSIDHYGLSGGLAARISGMTLEAQMFAYFTLGLLLFLLLIGIAWKFWTAANDDRVADVKGSPLRAGVATVEMKNVQYYQRRQTLANSGFATFLFGFRLDGRLLTTYTPADARTETTQVGDQVNLSYRIGKSGTYYLEDWSPMRKLK